MVEVLAVRTGTSGSSAVLAANLSEILKFRVGPLIDFFVPSCALCGRARIISITFMHACTWQDTRFALCGRACSVLRSVNV